MDEGQDRREIQAATGQVLGVHNCTIDVEEGEILVLMGLSGSGKSTLLRAVNGLNPLARGSVSVTEGGTMVNVTQANTATLRRLDEPFSALDPLIRTKLQDELLDLQRQLRRTIIFVSHDLDEAFKLGNKIAIMEGGRIVQAGTPQDIYRAPTNDYVADFIKHMNPLGVLRARDLMQPVNGAAQGALPADTLIKDGMDRLIGATHPIGVEENGALIGQLSKDDLLTGLARGSGVSTE